MGQEEQTSVKNISPTSSIGRIPDGLRSKIFESGDRGSNPLWEFRGEDLYKKQVNAAAVIGRSPSWFFTNCSLLEKETAASGTELRLFFPLCTISFLMPKHRHLTCLAHFTLLDMTFSC